MFGGLFNIVFTDYPGSAPDLRFLEEDGWLNDAAVMVHIYPEKGNWGAALVFGWIKNPYRFICRRMNRSFQTKLKAEFYAASCKRTAAKDRRGTLNIQPYDFNICYN